MNSEKVVGEERVAHTPTVRPWRVEANDERQQYTVIGNEPFTKHIATIGELDMSRETQHLNAELICRAVNSHEALVSALLAAQSDVAFGNLSAETKKAINEAVRSVSSGEWLQLNQHSKFTKGEPSGSRRRYGEVEVECEVT